MTLTPKERANILYLQMLEAQDRWDNDRECAKRCALIAVDKIIDTIYLNWYDSTNGVFEHWEEVKKELEAIN